MHSDVSKDVVASVFRVEELGVSLTMNGRCVKTHKKTNQIMPFLKARNIYIYIYIY